jgi:tetratricopeptide (TPR) repeat protein
MFICALLLAPAFVQTAGAASFCRAVITVVGVDAAGTPVRQSLGVALPGGFILTSAGALPPGGRGIIKSGDSSLHLAAEPVWQDHLQGLSLLQAATFEPADVAVITSRHLKVPFRVMVVVGPEPENGAVLQEAEVVSLLPLSPRLTLLQLAPEGLRSAPGAPVFTAAGELIGMYHDFAGVRLCLALTRADLPGLGNPGAPPEKASAASQPDAAPYKALWEGVAASLQANWPKALEKFEVARQSGADLPEAAFGCGVARHHLGDHAGGAADLEEAVRRLPDYALAYLWLGKAYDAQGRKPEAEAAFLRAAESAPELSESWFHLGLAAYRGGRPAEAKAYLLKAGDDLPQAPEKWWRLGQIAQAMGEWEDAQKAFGQALELNPDFLPALAARGTALLKLGRPREAAELLNRAAALQPRHPLIRYHLARAHLLSWNRAAAWEEYFALQKLEPDLAARLSKLLERGN